MDEDDEMGQFDMDDIASISSMSMRKQIETKRSNKIIPMDNGSNKPKINKKDSEESGRSQRNKKGSPKRSPKESPKRREGSRSKSSSPRSRKKEQSPSEDSFTMARKGKGRQQLDNSYEDNRNNNLNVYKKRNNDFEEDNGSMLSNQRNQKRKKREESPKSPKSPKRNEAMENKSPKRSYRNYEDDIFADINKDYGNSPKRGKDALDNSSQVSGKYKKNKNRQGSPNVAKINDESMVSERSKRSKIKEDLNNSKADAKPPNKIIKMNDSTPYKYSDEPIKLIDFSHGFQINPDALKLLYSIKEDIIVVSVVGKARTGKSYLMNLLLDQVGNKKSDGFKVASTLQSCTKGIWLWNNIKNSVNSNAKILFLDSEGTSSTDKSTKTYDSRIFALVVLISSLFLYNTYSNIDEHGISELSLAAHLSDAITTNSDDIEKDEILTQLSPKFIWIIRDFTLEKIHPETGQEITSKEYLELCLKNKRCGKNATDNNLIRQNIIKFFPDRDCVTLIRPLDDEEQLKQLNSIPFNDLKPEFKLEFKKLKDKIFKEALPKKYKGKKLNGPALACLIEEFVKTINSKKIPNISNSWDNIIENDVNESYNKARRYFKTNSDKIKISSNKVYDQAELISLLNKLHYEALDIYNEVYKLNVDTFSLINYANLLENKKVELNKEIEKIKSKLYKQNASYSSQFCQGVLEDSFHKIETNFYKNTYQGAGSVNNIIEDFNGFIKEYAANAKGNSKLEEYINYNIEKEKFLVEFLMGLVNKEGSKNLQNISSKMKVLEIEKEDVENKKRLLNTKKGYINDKEADMNKELEKLDNEINDINELLSERKKLLENLKKRNNDRKLRAIEEKHRRPTEESVDTKEGKEGKESRRKQKKDDSKCGCYIY